MVLDSFSVMIILVLLVLVAVRGRVRFASAARQRESLRLWEERWLSPTSLIEGTGSGPSQSARSEGDFDVLEGSDLGFGFDSGSGSASASAFASAFDDGKSLCGNWTGSYSYNDITKSSVKLEDGQFTAEISQVDKVIAGHITDVLGAASILGVIEYPNVRFAKSYESSNSPSWRIGEHLGKIYYEGRVSADGESMTGEWFQSPFERGAYAGSWRMVFKGREADETGLVPRKVEAADGSVLVPLKPKAVAPKAVALESSAPEAVAPEAVALESSASEAVAPEAVALESSAPEAASTKAVDETASCASAATSADENIVCPHCQAKTPGSFEFCLYCSQSLV